MPAVLKLATTEFTGDLNNLAYPLENNSVEQSSERWVLLGFFSILFKVIEASAYIMDVTINN